MFSGNQDLNPELFGYKPPAAAFLPNSADSLTSSLVLQAILRSHPAGQCLEQTGLAQKGAEGTSWDESSSGFQLQTSGRTARKLS